MTTASQLVDDVVRETRRPDMLSDILDYLNQTIRELHFTPDNGNAIKYDENFRELLLTVNAETGFSWTVPNPALFQEMGAVKYPSVYSRDGDVYARKMTPGRALNRVDYYYYRIGSTFVFSGYGGTNAQIALAYYEYPRSLRYYASADRPAVWDVEAMDFTYKDSFNTSDELRLDARNFTSNWLLIRWRDVVVEGVKAKVYKRLADDTRARTSYSLYGQLRNGIFTSEISVGGGLT